MILLRGRNCIRQRFAVAGRVMDHHQALCLVTLTNGVIANSISIPSKYFSTCVPFFSSVVPDLLDLDSGGDSNPNNSINKCGIEKEPSISVIQTGHVKWWSSRKGRGCIHKDDKFRTVPARPVEDKQTGILSEPNLLFFNSEGIFRPSNESNTNYANPVIKSRDRVQFEVLPDAANPKFQAVNIRFESGKAIPFFHFDDIHEAIRNERAKLGSDVFDIFEQVEDPKEMEKMIVKSFEQCKDNINSVKRQISDRNEAIKFLKSKLGRDVYEIFESAGTAPELTKKINTLFHRCRNNITQIEAEPANPNQVLSLENGIAK